MSGPDELPEPSDVSSDGLSAYSSDDESRHRAAVHVNIMALPTVRNEATRGEPAQPDLAEFSAANPLPSEIDRLSEAKLAEVVEWAERLSWKLRQVLAELEHEHAVEWLAKERALDQLMQKSIGDRHPPL